LASNPYYIEETFWIYGYKSKGKRPIIDDVVKKLVSGAHKKNITKQLIVVHNKLIKYNEDQFDMVICKCKQDAQRLHHTLQKVSNKQKIKSILFMGTASPATISRMYDVIKDNTDWPYTKIRRTSTRP
jgi:fibrillarin-like rRNA methylase